MFNSNLILGKNYPCSTEAPSRANCVESEGTLVMDAQYQTTSENTGGSDHQDEQHSNHFMMGLLVLLPLFILSWFAGVVLLLCFWNWFLVPLGAKSLSFLSGTGVWLFFSFLKQESTFPARERRQDYSYWKRYLKSQYFALGLFFALAWIIHQFTK